MKKTIVIILVVLLLATIAILASLLIEQLSKRQEKISAEKYQAKIQKELDAESLGRLLGLKGDSDICMNATNSSTQFYCYETVINSTESIQECDNFKDNLGVNGNWKYVCYRNLARRLKDKEICRKVIDDEDARSLCYAQVAQAALDEKICELATVPNRQGYCYNILGQKLNKPDLCFKAVDYEGSCFIELAYINRDSTLCENIVEAKPKDRCLRYAQGQRDDHGWIL